MTDSAQPQRRKRRSRTLLTVNTILLVQNVVVGLTILTVLRVTPPLLAFVAAVGDVILGTALAIRVLPHRDRLRRMAAAIPTLSPRVVAEGTTPPPPVKTLMEELERIGFQAVGVTDTDLPGEDPYRTWILVEESGETWIEVGMTDGRVICVVLSETPGGRQVEAMWPRLRTRIDAPELLVVPGSPTLELTIADHRSRLSAEHRAEAVLGLAPADPDRPNAWRVRSFDDYMAWEPRQRERTGGMRIREFLRTQIDPAIRTYVGIALIGFVCGAIVAAYAFRSGG
jgi:hypothetical protein